MEHIFHGNISKKGVSGYHHQSMMSQATLSNINTPNQYGVYKDTVTINGKSEFSTFFPDSWNRTEVINAIKEVYSGVKINGKGWYQGKTSQGMEIKMWINENNQIETSFPLY
nr:EndoU domain-containing protein [Brevibacillus sp. WF146]